jgi:poly-gamma-glutamate capsule biosynthesis protein CapA/YwtB (metallophosphatase superfamily)
MFVLLQRINSYNTWQLMAKISIGLTGDFCPMARMEQAYLSNQWRGTLESVKPFFDKNDFNVFDLECPLTLGTKKITKTGPHIKAHPNTGGMLPFLNCKYVVTANNHFKDYGWEGMQETYQALQKQGVNWLGSGRNIEEAAKPIVLEKDGIKITLFNMAEHEWTIASAAEPGCNSIDYPRALQQIQNAKAEGSDFVVVILHGGHEQYPLPSPRMKAQFRFMIDAGADAVVGHHTHIISGYELYKNKPIFYSLGNFCFDWPGLRNGTWNRGMVLRLVFSKNQKPEFEYAFIHQNDDFTGVRLADDAMANELEKEVQRLNAIIADDLQLVESFATYANSLKKVMLSRIQPYRNKYLVALNKRGLLPDLMGSSKKKMLQILAQCESHREVLLQVLHSFNK